MTSEIIMSNPSDISGSPAALGAEQGRAPAGIRHGRLTSLIRRAVVSALAYRALRAASARLSTLDDRTLKDIGFTRGEIGSVLADLADPGRPGSRIWPAPNR